MRGLHIILGLCSQPFLRDLLQNLLSAEAQRNTEPQRRQQVRKPVLPDIERENVTRDEQKDKANP